MNNQRINLTIGRQRDDDSWWLCLADMDGHDVSLVAQFTSEAHMHLFTQFMETQGYMSLRLPTNSELDELFDE